MVNMYFRRKVHHIIMRLELCGICYVGRSALLLFKYCYNASNRILKHTDAPVSEMRTRVHTFCCSTAWFILWETVKQEDRIFTKGTQNAKLSILRESPSVLRDSRKCVVHHLWSRSLSASRHQQNSLSSTICC